MVDNEQPFLESSEQLEFPNLTWVAQDLRKAYVLRVASSFKTHNQARFRSESVIYTEYTTQQLKRSKANHHARILVILLQNHLPSDREVEDLFDNCIDLPSPINYGQAPIYKLSTVLSSFVADILKCLRRFSLSNEIRWLKFRT